MASVFSQKAITVAPGGAAVSVKMTPPQKVQTVPVAKPTGVPSTPLTSTTPATPATPTGRVTVVSQVEFHFLFPVVKVIGCCFRF